MRSVRLSFEMPMDTITDRLNVDLVLNLSIVQISFALYVISVINEWCNNISVISDKL